MTKRVTLLLFFILSYFSTFIYAQTMLVSPANPTAEDTVTLTYFSDKGNKLLADYEGDIYVHTGVIIGTPEEPSGWRYVQGDWGKADARMKMQKIATNTYQYKLHIRSFYHILPDEPFLQLAMVFRNADGTRVGKEEGDKDIFYPKIKTYPNGVLESVSGKDGVDIGNLMDFEESANSILLKGSRRNVKLTYFDEAIIQVSYEEHRTMPAEYKEAVVAQPKIWKTRIENVANQPLRIKWGNQTQIEVSRTPLRLKFMRENKVLLVDELGYFEDKIEKITGLRFWLNENVNIYGGGSRAISANRYGHRFYTYNTATFSYTGGETRLNLSIPFFHFHTIHENKNIEVGLFVDNPRRGYFDLGKTEKNVLEYGVRDSALTYYLIMGDKPSDITEKYTYLTGRQGLPPMWSLGFLQSRFGYKSEKEVYDIVNKTQAADFPLDAVLLDLYWFGETKDMGNLTWQQDSFPNPKQMITNLEKKGVKTILITESYFVKGTKHYQELDEKGYFAKLANGKTAVISDFWAGAAALLDVYEPKAQTWFWNQYKTLRKDYLFHGWWCDSGEPENHPSRMIHKIGKAEDAHNLYPMFWAKMLYENHLKDFPQERLFNMTRSGYAGVQRYNIFPWSGDVSRSWEAFRAQTQIMLGAGICGIAYMHSDLGGFTGGPLDEELYTRWLQMGTFVPVMRAHGSGLPSEPVYFSQETQNAVKAAIKLHYRLLPHHYQLAYQNTTTGKPFVRPLFYHFPSDKKAANVDNEYLWGEHLLIAPVFEKGSTQQEIYLPEGNWWEYHSQKFYKGGTNITIPTQKNSIPFFLKEGAFLVETEQNLHNTSEYNTDSLFITYFVTDKKDTAYTQTFFFDDGKNPNSISKNQFATLVLNVKAKKGKVAISYEWKGTYPNMLAKRDITLKFISNRKDYTISFKGGQALINRKYPNIMRFEKWEGKKIAILFK